MEKKNEKDTAQTAVPTKEPHTIMPFLLAKPHKNDVTLYSGTQNVMATLNVKVLSGYMVKHAKLSLLSSFSC